MPIEIQIFSHKSTGEAPAGKYAARLLNEKAFGFTQTLNPCRSTQIIDGIHSGQIVPYDSYVVTGDLPAQADVLLQNEKLTVKLANAGLTIKNLEKYINERRESWTLERENFEHSLADAGLTIGGLRNELDACREVVSSLGEQIDELEEERNGKKVELPREVAKALDNLIKHGYSPGGIMHHKDNPENADDCHNELFIVRAYTNTHRKGEMSNSDTLILGLVHGYTPAPVSEKDNAAELLSGVTAIVERWWFEEPNGRKGKSHSDRLANDICDYIQQREDNKQPF